MLQNILQTSLDIFFPVSCVLCGKGDSHLCDSCRQSLPIAPKHIPRPSAALDSITICANYEDQRIQKLIVAYKFNGLKELSVPLGKVLRTAAPTLQPETVIIPIPLHRRRERTRGFNQSTLLAKEVAQATGLRLDTQLKRIRARRPQHTLHRAERLSNLKGAFSYSDAAPAHILLIDDITTTFSTLNEAAIELRKHGAQTVHGLVVAKNQP